MVSPTLGQQPYQWNRLTQELGASANVTVTAQGVPLVDNAPRTTTTSDTLFYGATREIELPALGGGGGGGGDSGRELPPLNGANGADGNPVNGATGAPGNAYAGLGGSAGQSGYAEASGTCVCIDSLNSNLQKLLTYSWIHNQWGDLDLKAAGGGGGGGGGTEGWDGVNPATILLIPGGNGGRGGAGDNAAGSVVATQNSDANIVAVCQVDPAVNPPPVAATPCDILLDIGWVSAPNPDWSPDPAWARNIAMVVRAGNSVATIIGNDPGPITVVASDDLGNLFFKSSVNNLNSDIGSFGLAAGEIGVTNVAPGQFASIVMLPNAINSVLTGTPVAAQGGSGGDRGLGGFFGSGIDGADGVDGGFGGNVLGGLGGAGGAGGIPDLFDVDSNGTRETFMGGGGRGGQGGDGVRHNEHKDGIFQGVVAIELT